MLEERLARLQQIADESSTTSTEVATTSTTEPTPETSTTSTTSTTATLAPPTQETVPEPEQADSSTAPTLPDNVLSLPKEFDQFRFSYESVDLLPDLPTTLEGFDPFDGEDVHGREGLVRQDEVRLFEGDSVFTLPYEFASQINRCGDRYWVLRWVSFNPNVLIVASNAIDPYFSENYNPDLSLLPPPATAGIMGNTICYAPGFRFHSAPSSLANLVDVAFEWTYYDRDPFARSG